MGKKNLNPIAILLRSNRAFATVYIVIIFSSMMLFMLTALVIAGGYAASSISEDLTYVAGRSVLSEFQPELYSRYGLFALKSNGNNIQELLRYYVEKGLSGEGIVPLECESISADAGEHGGLNTMALSVQLRRLGKLTAAKDLLSEADILSGAEAAGEQAVSSESIGPGYVSELTDLASYSDAEYDKDGKCIKPDSATARETRRQASELLRQYNQGVNYSGSEGTAGNDGCKLSTDQLEELPTKVLGLRSLSPLLSGGISTAGANAVLENSYIVNACSNQVNNYENTLLKSEVEYILYGKNSDKANEKAARLSLFGLRFSVNLAEIFSTPETLGQITAMASSAFFLIPAPIAVFMLASAQAGTEAKVQVGTLLSGGSVPLSTVAKNIDSYKDYLGMILLFLDEDVKLARLMDVMQMNLKSVDKINFAFADYCYGFDVNMVYVNKGVFGHLTGIGNRRKTVETVFTYK